MFVLINDYFYIGYREHGGTVCYSLTTNIANQLLCRYYPILLPSDGMTGSLSASVFARRFYNVYVFYPFLCDNTIFESQIDNEKLISKKFITRHQRLMLKQFLRIYSSSRQHHNIALDYILQWLIW